jgi:hypothetical protein
MTPTNTPTMTPTPTPIPCCTALNATVLTACQPDPNGQGANINYRTSFDNNCFGGVQANVTYSLEVTASDPPTGGWTNWTSTAPITQYFPAQSTTVINRTFANQAVPTTYLYYRVRVHIDQGVSGCQVFDFYSDADFLCYANLADHPTGSVAPGMSPTMHHW